MKYDDLPSSTFASMIGDTHIAGQSRPGAKVLESGNRLMRQRDLSTIGWRMPKVVSCGFLDHDDLETAHCQGAGATESRRSAPNDDDVIVHFSYRCRTRDQYCPAR